MPETNPKADSPKAHLVTERHSVEDGTPMSWSHTKQQVRPESIFEETGSWAEGHWYEVAGLIHEGRTSFQRVAIYDTAEYGAMLVLDGIVQSVEEDEYIYHECLVQPALTAHPRPRRVLVIGGGEGATIREVLRHPDVGRVVMVDIDEELVEICKTYLSAWHQGAFADERVELVIGDGKRYVETADEVFDVIIVDVVDAFDDGPATALYCEAFYQQVARRLASGGILAVQAMELCGTEHADHRRVLGELRAVFRYTRSYSVFIPSFWCEWGYIVASDEIDVAALPPTEIDGELARRGVEAQLRFYDGGAHRKLFTLSKDVRRALNGDGA